MTDQEIIRRIDDIYQSVLRKTGIEPNEDLYQDVACVYLEIMASNVSPKSMHARVYTACLRRIDAAAKRKVDDSRLLEDFDENTMMIQVMSKHDLQNTISTLIDKYEDVIKLYYFEGLTYKEIGRLKGVTPNAISFRFSKAIRALRHPVRRKSIKDLYDLMMER